MTIFPKNIENTSSKIKVPTKNQLLIILLVGVLIVVIALPTKKTEEKKTTSDWGIQEESDNSTELEQRLESALQDVEGIGKVKVMITLTSSENFAQKVSGIVVVTQNGDNAVVKQNITEAIQALFDVDTHKIKIMKMKSN
ncbi:hypothetical protein ACTQ6A_06710 [Lachnospiraceae bacterium LCP25S3_G4]